MNIKKKFKDILNKDWEEHLIPYFTLYKNKKMNYDTLYTLYGMSIEPMFIIRKKEPNLWHAFNGKGFFNFVPLTSVLGPYNILSIILIGNFLKNHPKFNFISINFMSQFRLPTKGIIIRKKAKIDSLKRKEIMFLKYKRLTKSKKRLFKKEQKIYRNYKRTSLLSKHNNLSLFSSIGVYISFISLYENKNRRNYENIKDYQEALFSEINQSLLFKIFKVSTSYYWLNKPNFNIAFYGYRSIFYSLISRFKTIKGINSMDLTMRFLPKRSFKVNFKRRKVRSIKKRHKREHKYYI